MPNEFWDKCDQLPHVDCLLCLGKPMPHWVVTRGLPKNNLRTITSFGFWLAVMALRWMLVGSADNSSAAVAQLIIIYPRIPLYTTD